MKKITFCTEIASPPTEILLLKYGKTETRDGPYFLTKESAKRVIDEYENHGVHCFFDYRHLSIKGKTAEDGIAAGWFDLELREDGIWAINIDWTPKAYSYITNKEYLYISPAFVSGEDEIVFKLKNVALTNTPATDNLEPLVALEASDEEETEIESKKEPMKKEEKGHLMKAKKHLKTYAVHASKEMMESEDEDVKKMYSAHQDKVMKMAEEIKGHLKDMGEDDEEDGDEGDDEEVTTLSASLKELTGKVRTADQLMVVTAYKNSQETIKMLSDEKSGLEMELKSLKTRMLEDEKLKLVDEAISGKEKKLFPKQKQWALSLSVDQIKSYLEATPVLSISTKYVQPEVSIEEVRTLSAEDEMVIKLMEQSGTKIDKEKYLQDKAKRSKK